MESSTASPPGTRSGRREKLLRRVILPSIRGQNCPICLGSLEPRSAAVLEACKHAYCLRCIHKWSTLRRKCPLCNSIFESWFDTISLSSRSFHREILPNASATGTGSFRLHDAHPRSANFSWSFWFWSFRFVEIAIWTWIFFFFIYITIRNVMNERRRSRPLPWRRSFGRPGSVAADVIAERKLQWRAR